MRAVPAKKNTAAPDRRSVRKPPENGENTPSFFSFYPANFAGEKLNLSAPEALAGLPYAEELKLKGQALNSYLKETLPAGLPAPAAIVPAPVSRAYRTTGKRRITFRNGNVWLHWGRVPGREPVEPSLLEPPEHMAIYRMVQERLALPRFREAAQSANYCIVRGAGSDRTLILNVRRLSAGIVRGLRSIAEAVSAEIPSVRSAFLYVDETGSDYYLEAERPAGKLGWKHLFGPEQLALRLLCPEPKKFLYPPTGFSQINESVLPVFAKVLEEKLSPGEHDQLLDLYCGYGLWSLLLAPKVRNVWGAELSAEAVAAARGNAAYHYPRQEISFRTGAIDRDFLREALPPPRKERELVLLDPPRHGTAPGVLETLIARRPRRIAHVFCGVDEIPATLKLYCSNGCKAEAIQPFDFFPGTLNLEVLAILCPPEEKVSARR